MKKGDSKTLLFYNQKNKADDKYQLIKLPNRESIKQYVYENKVLVILTSDNKILYCNNCDLISSNIVWNELATNTLSSPSLSRIAINNNKIFVLYGNGLISMRNNFNNSTINSPWTNVELPEGESSFKYMDAQYNHLVAIGSFMNFIYHKDITETGLSTNWTILDKSQLMESIKVTLHGYLGKTGPNELYQCKFPCDGTTDNTWNLINSDITSSINANSEVISLVKNNALFSCDKTCSSSSMTQLSEPTKYTLYNGMVVDFVYPKLELIPTLAPLDESKVPEVGGKINDSLSKYQIIQNKFGDINQKMTRFSNVQSDFDNTYNNLNNQRNTLINTIMGKIGVSMVEKFEDQLSLNSVMNKVNKKITIRGDEEEEKKGALSTSLIIAL
jgi:hypothetical protein